MEKRICESCGMPITSKDQLGTNLDGSINEDYCKYCYEKKNIKEISFENIRNLVDNIVKNDKSENIHMKDSLER